MRGFRCLTRIYKDRGEIPLDKKAFGEKVSLSVYTEIFKKSDKLEHVSLSPCYFCCLYWVSSWGICSVPFWVPVPNGQGVWEMRWDKMSWQRIVLPPVSQKCLLLLLRNRWLFQASLDLNLECVRLWMYVARKGNMIILSIKMTLLM